MVKTLRIVFSFLLLGISSVLLAQPSFEVRIENEQKVSTTEYQFDIKLYATGATTSWELAGFTVGIGVNPNWRNGATISTTASTILMAGTSDMNTSPSQVPISGTFSTATPNRLQIASTSSPGAGSGTMITQTGKRLIRVKLLATSGVFSDTASPNLYWLYSGYATSLSAYVSGVNTIIANSTLTAASNNASLLSPRYWNGVSWYKTTWSTGSTYVVSGANPTTNEEVTIYRTINGNTTGAISARQLYITAGDSLVSGGTATVSVTDRLYSEGAMYAYRLQLTGGNQTVTFLNNSLTVRRFYCSGGNTKTLNLLSSVSNSVIDSMSITGNTTVIANPSNSIALACGCVNYVQSGSTESGFSTSSAVTTITSQPASVTVNSGSPASFTVSATGSGALTYQWYKNGTAISGATSSSYSIATVAPSDSGNYTVVITGLCGQSTSNIAKLTVNFLTINTQPGSLIRCEGASASLSVAAVGSGTLTYQWKKNGVVLTGVTSSSITLNSLTVSDSGDYQVVISNGLTQVTSSTAHLTVYANLNVVSQPVDFVQNAGTTATFRVVITGGGYVTFQWKKYVNGSWAVISGATDSVYTIPSVSVTDSGSYTCTITSTCPSTPTVTVPARMLVNYLQITTQPTAQNICIGQSATLSVVAAGNGTLSYQWRKNGVDISGATSSSYTIPAVAFADSGNYQVVVSNSISTLNSNTVKLTVYPNTVISSHPVSQSVISGNSVSFSVTATGGGTLTYQWKKNGNAISGATSATYTIGSVVPADSGVYTCVVTGACGTATSNSATLTVSFLNINTQPTANPSNCEGATITLFVGANGNGTITYQWRKNGVNINGQTSNTLVFNPLLLSDSGQYTVVVSNGLVQVTSSVSNLTVKAKPFITTQPLTQSVNSGSNLVLSVVAGGYPPLSYVWKKNGTTITNGGNVSGATSATLTITGVALSDSGQYTVTVSGLCSPSIVSNTAVVTINYLTITSQPTGTSACVGQSATFTVAANGNGTLTYQWRKNGVDIVGANNSSLTINPINYSDSGTYTVVVSNGFISTTSNSAYLMVPVGTVITTQPLSQTKNAGSNVTFNTVVTGSGPFTYVWKKNGNVIAGQTLSTLTLLSITPADSGTYTCTITGPCGSQTTNNAVLTVVYLNITLDPTDQIVCAGDSVVFTGAAIGSGTITYQWKKNAVAISGATSTTLVLHNVQASDAGFYSLQSSNGTLNKTSSSAQLTVNALTAITTQPSNQTVNSGSNAALTVVATGSGTLTYQWKKNGVAVSGATGSSITFNPALVTDTGNYTCVITGSCGTVSTNTARLNVNYLQINTQPLARTMCEGTIDSLYVIASGNGTLSYQWNKAGNPISGATSSVLKFNPVATTDAGLYTVKISNGIMPDVTSAAVSINVNAATKITTQPISLLKNLGQSASFSVSATGSGTLTYQWYRNGIAISGATLASYSVASVGVADSGTYYVVVLGTCGPKSSDTVRLDVNFLQINTQPTNTSVCEGNPANLSVSASGLGTLTYQWYKNGVAISGATSSVLNFNPAQLSDSGSYYVKVSNGNQNISSGTVKLVVSQNISITTQPLGASKNAGTSYTFHVGFVGTGPYTFQWYKNGNFILNATDSIYTIASIAAKDSGNYTVTITGLCNSKTSDPAKLNVNYLSIITQPTAQSVCSNATLTLSVLASGSGTLTYQWYNNGTPISGATSATYTKTNPTISDSGTYTVQISNGSQNLTSNAVKVTIKLLPTYTTQPVSVTQNPGTNVSFTPAVSGFAPITYQWYKNSSSLSGATSSTLNINSISATDVGFYILTATNTCGSVKSDTAFLRMNTISIVKQPVNTSGCEGTAVRLSVYAISNQSITFQWKHEGIDIPGAIDSFYIISSLSAADTGNYSVSISSPTLLAASNSVRVSMKAQTAITTQPVDVSQNAGANATFTVSATGSGNLSFRWLKNGSYINNATGSSLTLVAISANDAGNYQVEITGDCGMVRSAIAKLFVKGTTVRFLKQPVSQQLCSGTNAYFSVVATGKGTLKYQWKKNGVNINGANSADLNITKITSAEAAGYSVQVNDDSDTGLSQTATLTIFDLPAVGPITGPTFVSNITNPISYSVPTTANTTYSWTITGGTLVSGQNQSTIFVKWNLTSNARIALKVTNLDHGCSDTSSIPIHIAGTGGIEDILGISNFELYPNPNQGDFALDFDAPTAGSMKFRLLDMAGKQCWSDEVHHGSGKQHIPFTTSLQAGVYNLQMEQNGRFMHVRVVIR